MYRISSTRLPEVSKIVNQLVLYLMDTWQEYSINNQSTCITVPYASCTSYSQCILLFLICSALYDLYDNNNREVGDNEYDNVNNNKMSFKMMLHKQHYHILATTTTLASPMIIPFRRIHNCHDDNNTSKNDYR